MAKSAHLHALSSDKSNPLTILLVTAGLCYTGFRYHVIEIREEMLHSFSKNVILFQHQLKWDRKAVWRIQNLFLTRYQPVVTSTATG